jgi:hypothetical protein
MACTYTNQDRYIVISSPTASLKAIHLACRSFTGDATACPIPCLNPHSDCFFAFLQSALHSSRTHIKLKSSPAHPMPRPLATVDARNPHSRARNVGCTTSRDFLPWRFCDAACWSGQLSLVCGVAETCTEAGIGASASSRL